VFFCLHVRSCDPCVDKVTQVSIFVGRISNTHEFASFDVFTVGYFRVPVLWSVRLEQIPPRRSVISHVTETLMHKFITQIYYSTYFLRPLACWDCGFESCQRNGCLSLVSIVCCQVDVPASGWSPVLRSPTDCGVSECDREASIIRTPWPTMSCCAIENKNILILIYRMYSWLCIMTFIPSINALTKLCF
jgi:hypothetical protein